MTRWDCHKYARDAWEAGIRFIGACCGMEPYHVRAFAEELHEERGGNTARSSYKHEPWGKGLMLHTKPWVRARYVETDSKPSKLCFTSAFVQTYHQLLYFYTYSM